MSRPYDILLLDADNTLLDFSRSEKNALDITFRHYGLTITDEIRALYHTINRSLWAAFERGEISKETITATRFTRLFAETGYAVDGAAFSRDYQKTLGEGYDLIDGAKALCEALAGKYRLYCVTNGVAVTQYSRLARSGLDTCFDGIFVSETIGHQKPDIAYFRAVFNAIPHFSPDKTLIVGDSLTSDIQGGKNAGIATCWYNPGGQQAEPPLAPDHEIRTLNELHAILENHRPL